MDADNASHHSVRGSRIERMHRRHCSFNKDDTVTKSQPSNIIHVTIRKLEGDPLHNQKNRQFKQELVSFSTVLSARHRQTLLNQPSMRSNISRDILPPFNESNISQDPSVLGISQNSCNSNDLSINSKQGRNLNRTNEGNPMNINEKSVSIARVRHIKSGVRSPRVIPHQDNLSGKISAKESIPVSNGTNNMNDNGRSNRLDLMTNHTNFRANPNNNKNKRKNCFWPPTRPCVFCTILTVLLLGAVIGATIGGVLSQQKSTTITTGITTTATTATTTSITTTTSVTTTSVTTSTTTDTTTTTSASSTTTTTTNLACGSSCVNATVTISSRLAFYSFDNVTTDVTTNNYTASGITSPVYVSGWIGSAISFDYFDMQLLSTPHIPLDSRSFTIDFWFFATNLSTSWDFSFGGQYESHSFSRCLFLNIRNRKLCFGFYASDAIGSANITTSKWHHVAFVYDNTTYRQSIYLNGLLEISRSSSPLLITTGAFTIGGARIGGNTNSTVYYSGYIDHFTISSRAKSACEIYLAATLACYFTFDSATSIDDSGPNFLTGSNIGATSTTGRINQALQFSSALSYIVINGISALTSSNTAFTISMWVNPTSVTGGATLIHASARSNGQGDCLVMWGLTTNGMVSVNVINSFNNTISLNASSVLSINSWTHIAHTFSTTNGSYLYINGTLITSVSVPTGRAKGPYVFLGASPSGTISCLAGSVTTGQFFGSIDEYRVFGIQLSSTDICRLANP